MWKIKIFKTPISRHMKIWNSLYEDLICLKILKNQIVHFNVVTHIVIRILKKVLLFYYHFDICKKHNVSV